MHTEAVATFRSQMTAYLSEHEKVDEIIYDVGVVLMPDNARPGVFHPVLAFFVQIENPLLGAPRLSFSGISFNVDPGVEYVEENLAKMLEALRQARSQILQGKDPNQEADPTPKKSGIVIGS